jgi:hypothetical protein
MTVQELGIALAQGEKIVFIDVREPSEYMRLNIGGNRLNLEELKLRIEALKRLCTEGGYKIVIGCTYHDSKRTPPMKRLLNNSDIQCEILEGSKMTGGGIVAYTNKYGKTMRVPNVNIPITT